ncbi:glycine zipper 2TM domain-containing protein [Pantoea sp. Mhis]|uniref:outer membrane lipoprotein n=1 Tax=Pantoea sp. Mhis TaxID=2576759 RepID=UPI001356B17E|nr:glycine zipper 2TM domain-containing protein [Pantoea sp. Mhis]MXP56204.1 glycine zipper 2TM domain-containing protein [Pantoea sp. Mhis]
MINHFLSLILISLILTNCASNDPYYQDTYSHNEIKQVHNVFYGTLISMKPVHIELNNDRNVSGIVSGAVLGGFLGNTIGGGTGRNLATASGVIMGGLVGQHIQNMNNKANGVALEIRKDNGHVVMIIQKQSINHYVIGQRVMIVSNNNKIITVTPR